MARADAVITKPLEGKDFRAAVNALLAARELSFVLGGHRSLIQITPLREAPGARRAAGMKQG